MDDSVQSVTYQQKRPDFQHIENPVLKDAYKQLKAYFDGRLKHFDIPLDIQAYPQFYQHVWNVVEKIPYGKLKSYSDIAFELGDIKKLRAVGQANARNPFPLLIPCHRVVGKNKSLTGYVFGLGVKKWLLQHEGSLAVQFSLF